MVIREEDGAGAWRSLARLLHASWIHSQFIRCNCTIERRREGVLSSPNSLRCIIKVGLLYLAAADAWRQWSSAGSGWWSECRVGCNFCVFVHDWRRQHKHQPQDLMLHSGPVGKTVDMSILKKALLISFQVVNTTWKFTVTGNLSNSPIHRQWKTGFCFHH